jgi:hypothetical protein
MSNQIQIKLLSYDDIFDNEYIMKMILNFSIETSRKMFIAITLFKKSYNKANHKKQLLDSINKTPISIIIHSNDIIGFFYEKEFEQTDIEDMILSLDSIYIEPKFRNKGYCKAFLIEYSKKPRIILADNVISKIIVSLIDYEKPINEWYYYPNFDGKNMKIFINKDKSFNWNSNGLLKYRKK